MKRNNNVIYKFIQQKEQDKLPPIFIIYWLFNLINSAEIYFILRQYDLNLVLKLLISLSLPPIVNFLWMAETNFYTIFNGKGYKWYENSLFVLSQCFILLYTIIAVF